MQFKYLRLILAKSLCLNGERLDFMGQVPFLKKPIYKRFASYGHFGRRDLDLPWENVEEKALQLEEASKVFL